MTALPVTDWQFVVVSAIALVALLVLLRRVAPRPARRRPAGAGPQPACAHCASNPATAPPARTTTTAVVAVSDLRQTGRKRAEPAGGAQTEGDRADAARNDGRAR